MSKFIEQSWGLIIKHPLAPAALATLAVAYILYTASLPKPIPGIPYNKRAARTMFGDLPIILRESGGNVLDWAVTRALSHETPLCQIFMLPFGGPMLVLSDYREAQDILLRQGKIWDRSDWLIERVRGVAPEHQINKKTDASWKNNRRLVQDLMSPPFLNNVAAPNIYRSVQRLIELWTTKAHLSDGKPLPASQDIFYAALDAVLSFCFGDSFPHRALTPQVELIQNSAADAVMESDGAHESVTFKEAPIHATLTATINIAVEIGMAVNSISPSLVWKWLTLSPWHRRMRRDRTEYIQDQISMAAERLKARGLKADMESTTGLKSAIDLMVDRETRFAIKEGRSPVYLSQVMIDEVIGFVVAGHDTTSTTMLWAMKLLADHPRVQDNLREALHNAHKEAKSEKRMPDAGEIVKASVDYLDAVIEEVLRCGCTAPVTTRQCNQDTTILGHHIPNGTTLMILSKGPSISQPAFALDEGVRSTSCQTAKARGVREWDAEGMDQFKPERWLVNDDGKVTFDSTAGPTIPFGLGVRSCYGKRLAYLQLKIMMTLIFWNFELLKCPEELSVYDPFEELTHKPKVCYVKLKVVDY